MIEDIDIRLEEVWKNVQMGDAITVRDQTLLKSDLYNLQQVTHVIRDNKTSPLTPDQLHFVKNVLRTAIKEQVPRFEKLLDVYDLQLTDTLTIDCTKCRTYGMFF